MRTKLKWAVILAGLALASSGCRSFHPFGHFKGNACNKPGATVYGTAQSIAPLRTPPGLDAPDTHAALRIPELKEPAPPPRRSTDPCLDEPPPYAVPKTRPPPAA